MLFKPSAILRHFTIGALSIVAFAANPALAQRGPASVFVETVEPREFSNRIEALGTLQANERVELTVNVSDRVTGIFFDDGQRVEAGDTLLSLVQTEQAARIEGAVATLTESRNVVKRMEPLVEDGGVAMMAYEEAKRDVAVAEAELAAFRVQQNERVLTAPFDGLLGFRRVSKGAYLSPGQVVTTLVDDSVMKLDFEVPSLNVSQLKPGIEIEARTDDFPDRSFTGEITSIDNAIDPVTRSVQVRAIIDNEDRLLRAGTFMTVVVNASPSLSLAVPEEAIQPRGPKSFVFVVESENGTDIATQREIEPGRREDRYVEVLNGLSEGERVITEGVIRVREGSEVKIEDRSMLFPSGRGEPGVAESTPISFK